MITLYMREITDISIYCVKCDSWYAKSNKTLTFEELMARGIKWNKKHNDPPLGESIVSEVVKQSMPFIDNNNIQNNIASSTNSIQASMLNDNKSNIQKEIINQDELMEENIWH